MNSSATHATLDTEGGCSTAIEPIAQELLETVFMVERSPSFAARTRLAAKLIIPEPQIDAWFQQRRQRKPWPSEESRTLSPTPHSVMPDVVENIDLDMLVEISAAAEEDNRVETAFFHERHLGDMESNAQLHIASEASSTFPANDLLTLHLDDVLAFGECFGEAMDSLATNGNQGQPYVAAAVETQSQPGSWMGDDKASRTVNWQRLGQLSHQRTPLSQCSSHSSTSRQTSLVPSESSETPDNLQEEGLQDATCWDAEPVVAMHPPAHLMPFQGDGLLPLNNVAKIIAANIPNGAKVARDSKLHVQQAISEFMAFLITEAAHISGQSLETSLSRKNVITPSHLKQALENLGATTPVSLTPTMTPTPFIAVAAQGRPCPPRGLTFLRPCVQGWTPSSQR